MPPQGYKTLTIRTEAYDVLMEEYKNSPPEWRVRHGITSFNGYVNFRLSELIQHKKQNPPQTNP